MPVEWLGFLVTGTIVAGWCWRRQEPFLDRAATGFMVACLFWMIAMMLGTGLAVGFGLRFPVNSCIGFALCCAFPAGLLGVASWFTSPKAPEGSGLSPSEESS